jgi:hypothetical protein
MLEGYAAGADSAVDIAADLVTLKRNHLSDLQGELAAASALFGQELSNVGV